MCVSQFRAYCAASNIQVDGGDFSRKTDMENPDVEVKKDFYEQYRDENGRVWQSVYYRTDLRKMRQLAKNGNAYAIAHLENLAK